MLFLRYCLFLLCTAVSPVLPAQRTSNEFPKEFILHLKLGSGLVAIPSGPELFVGTLDLRLQWTIVPHLLRGGLVAGGFYSARRLSGLGGFTASLKLSEFRSGYFGSIGNLHLTADHLWGTKDQRLAGLGLHLDLANRVVIGVAGHRDYAFANWWWTSSLALRLSKTKNSFEQDIPH